MGGRATILCVDDEPGVLHALERLLGDEYEVLTAASGPEGLAVLERRQPVHVVLSDHRMPGMSGADFLREVRRRFPLTVSILLSGFLDEDAPFAEIDERGTFGVLTKPWDDAKLRAAVSEAVKRYFVLGRAGVAAQGAAAESGVAAEEQAGAPPVGGDGVEEPFAAGAGRPRILFVDDEENVLSALRRMCLEEDFEVSLASSGEAGLEMLKAHPEVAVIVTDQRMPGMTGSEFLAGARKIAPHAVRMVLTGYADVAAAVEAINEGGAHRYIAKPWNDDELLQTLRDAVARHRVEAENRRLAAVVERKNEELRRWNEELNRRVLEQTRTIREQNERLLELNARLTRAFDAALSAFSALIELRDRRVRDHSQKVAAAAWAAAGACGLAENDAATIRAAGLLHDIGKIGVPDVLLLTPFDEMSEEEKKEYAAHPVRGQTAVDAVEELREAGILIRHHHERFDGNGYPDGLKGTAIPLGARIIALADFLDRTTAAYSGDNAVDLALEEARKAARTRFDPDLFPRAAEAMAKVLAERLPRQGTVEKVLLPGELREGMVLSRDVRSGTGVLILRAGTRLCAAGIAALRRRRALDPSPEGIFVLVENEKT